MASETRQPFLTYLSPDQGDFLFWEEATLSREDWTDLETSTRYAYGTAHPDSTKYPNHKVVFVQHDPSKDERGQSVQDHYRCRVYYAASRSDEDAYNFAHVTADIGGQRFDAVERTYIMLRSAYNEATPAPGSAMPRDPSNKFPVGYILASRQQQRIGDRELDSLFVVEKRTYVKRVTISRVDFDEFFRTSNKTTETLYYTGEVVSGSDTIDTVIADPDHAFWGMDANGTVTSGRQLTADWFLVTAQQVVNTDGTGSVTYSYQTTVNYSFPSVLSNIAIDVWERRDGGVERYVRPEYSLHGYSGPCKAQVTVTWSKTKPTFPDVDEPPKPLPIVFSSPIIAPSIPPTLHALQSISLTNGTEDPVYEYTAGTYSFPATNYTTWPDSLKIKADVRPFRGGWLKEEVVVYSP